MPPPDSSRPASGWPFWWRWVLATNLGWFPGIYAGMQASLLVPESQPVLRAALAATIAAAGFGAAQAFVLRGLLSRPATWFVATVVGWAVGVALTRSVLLAAGGASAAVEMVCVAFGAGAVVGVFQARLLAKHVAASGWWPLISALGWAALFPGALPGLGLVWLDRRTGPRSELLMSGETPCR